MKSREERLICKNCNNTFDTNVVYEIDDNDGNILDDLMEDKYNIFVCPHCKKTSVYPHDLLIIDNKIHTKIQITKDKKKAIEFVRESDEEALKGTKYRLIMNNITSAIEKYLIFKCGLDDKIIEIYKDNIARELLANNIAFDNIHFIASSVNDYGFLVSNKNDSTEYMLDMEKYNMLVNNFKSFSFITRNNDYIVDGEYIYNMKQEVLNYEPIHIDKLFREHNLCAIVEVDKEILIYNANFIAYGKKVLVNVNGVLKEGIYRDICELSEERLGRKFKTLEDIKKVYYEENEIKYLLNNVVLDNLCKDLNIYQIVSNISKKEFDKLNLNNIVKCNNLLVAPRVLVNKTEKVIILSNTSRVGFDENYQYASFNNDYFLVVYSDTFKKVLLHLPYNIWHLINEDIDLKERLALVMNIIKDDKSYENINFNESAYYYNINKKASLDLVESPLEIISEYVIS